MSAERRQQLRYQRQTNGRRVSAAGSDRWQDEHSKQEEGYFYKILSIPVISSALQHQVNVDKFDKKGSVSCRCPLLFLVIC